MMKNKSYIIQLILILIFASSAHATDTERYKVSTDITPYGNVSKADLDNGNYIGSWFSSVSMHDKLYGNTSPGVPAAIKGGIYTIDPYSFSSVSPISQSDIDAHYPNPVIDTPTINQTFSLQGTPIDFSARGSTDPDEDVLEYVWLSDINGVIGREEDFTYSDLSVGVHSITLMAHDRNGATGTANRTLTVTDGSVTFDPPGGMFNGPLNVTVSTDLANTPITIHYTFDGTDPIEASPVAIDGIIYIDSSVTLKAKAYYSDINVWGTTSTPTNPFVIEDAAYTIGQEIPPPTGVDLNKTPTFSSNFFYWKNQKLYAVGEVSGATIEWYDSANNPIQVFASNAFSNNVNDYQTYIVGSTDVNLLKDNFSSIALAYSQVNSSNESAGTYESTTGKFRSLIPGKSVLVFENLVQQPPQPPQFLLVDAVTWSSQASGNEIPWNIGTKITENIHNSSCGGGHVYNADSPISLDSGQYSKFDGYNKDTREGLIVPIKLDETQVTSDDLVVVWYEQNTSGICWPYQAKKYLPKWPENPQIHVAGSARVDLKATQMKKYSTSAFAIVQSHQFTNEDSGYTVFAYVDDSVDPVFNEAVFTVVQTVFWYDDAWRADSDSIIGNRISDVAHDDSCGGGFVYNEVAPYAPNTLGDVPYNGYKRDTREGPIVPVNLDYDASRDNDLTIVWYQRDNIGVCWPYKPVKYTPKWPVSPKVIDIADMKGSGDLDSQTFQGPPKVYEQTDPLVPGFNPNEEHALTLKNILYAKRIDYNHTYLNGVKGEVIDSEPYSILSYKNPQNNNEWFFRVYKIIVGDLTYPVKAGRLIQPPAPLSSEPICAQSVIDADLSPAWATWRDYYDNIWAAAANIETNGPQNVTARFYESWQGECIPWLDYGTGEPAEVTYEIHWPDDEFWNTYPSAESPMKTSDVPELQIGETLLHPKNGLPEIDGQCSVKIVMDQTKELGAGDNVKLIDVLSEREVELAVLPVEIKIRNEKGKLVFLDLPFHLQSRLSYDPINSKLEFKGILDEAGAGEPLLLINVMDVNERAQLKALSADIAYQSAVEELYNQTRSQLVGQTELIGGRKALSAGSAVGKGYVTLAMHANEDTCRPDPISLIVLKVVDELYDGEIKVIEPDDVFDESVTMRHNSDFSGEPESRFFQWMYSYPEDNGTCPTKPAVDDISGWFQYTLPEGTWSEGYAGAVGVTIEGPGLRTLQDMCLSMRYRGYEQVGVNTWSSWTSSQLYEGWIKRVMRGINPYEQRVKDFHETEVDTVVSMIAQAGQRYEGDIALNSDPNNINDIGLIEIYETVIRRGTSLSIEGAPPVDDAGANKALLLAAGRIADLYMLLGNEAYADAADPTIGFGTEDGQYGSSEATSIFTFQNQVASLLEEELALLRGRDDSGTTIEVNPFYNRLIWNFTSSIDGGEVAYALNYNIKDTDNDGEIDGFITEEDAKNLYPQGHGDAWGHYLTAIKSYYNLLKHPNYTWIPRAESVLVAGIPVQVDYLDERKFATSAAAKAKAGSEIVNLTYRQVYSGDPSKQWKGYKDNDTEKAWGVSEWATRAGQGAYFDWVVGNRLIPEKDIVHTGIAKVDRSTVVALRDVVANYINIQSKMDEADKGLNPLGLAKDVIPFDIDPSAFDNGKTHFEQVYERAVTVMNSAIAVFNYANQNSQLIRRQQDTLEDFQRNVNDREADFNNRLIEVFGYPYPEDIGPTGTYSEGYNGPDLYHYMYVDPSELMKKIPGKASTLEFEVNVADITVEDNGNIGKQVKNIKFHLSRNGFGLVKPDNWTGRRRAPGEIQQARSNLLQIKARFEKAEGEYENLLARIEDQAAMIEAQFNVNAQEIKLLYKGVEQQQSLNDEIKRARERQLDFRTNGRLAVLIANAFSESLPTVTGVIAGTASGFIVDLTSTQRGVIKYAASVVNEFMTQEADDASIDELGHQQAKERAQSLSSIELKTLQQGLAFDQQIKQLEQLVRQEVLQRLELYTVQENMQQSQGQYLSTWAKGLRIKEDRLRFRQQTAGQIQNYRYKDMAFRIFRNDALQKYRAQFDMASRYAYLAAKAYDYETNLIGTNASDRQQFLDDIVKARTIGLITGGQPITGTGLADPMARMSSNFTVQKGQLGINNPQNETNRFSLRKEFLRITRTSSSDEVWQNELEGYRVSNLHDMPEFLRFARPFADKDTKQPAIVIPFVTNITSGLNYFGWPLGGGDSYYSPTNFATKIRSVGVWFTNYNNLGMVETPRVYLIPVGVDVLRSPVSGNMSTQAWQVVDQKLPLPFPIGNVPGDLGWIPIFDSVFGEWGEIRRHSDFRAYHDSGMNDSQLTPDSRLISRSVWNTKWLLIIPGANLLGDPDEGIDRFIHGSKIAGTDTRDGNGVTDIKIFFKTYAYSGN